ncbi:MAG: NUDIX domain-containing protein [Candidatus Pacearchaeota archaeon]
MSIIIPSKEYSKILEYVPLACVDVVIVKNKKVLLIQRNASGSFENEWWLPGGRIYKNEGLNDAVHRKVFEETGLKVTIKRQLGSYEAFDKKTSQEGVKSGTHTIATVFIGELEGIERIKLDKSHNNYKWVTAIDPNLHPYIRQILKDAKVFV